MSDKPEGPIDQSALDRVVERLSAKLSEAEVTSWEYLQSMIEEAVQLEMAAEEMTQDELDLLAAYVKRDLSTLGLQAHRAGEGVAAWLNFDLNILEHRMAEMLLSVADGTRLQQELLRERLDHSAAQYLTGELALPGTLSCVNCGQLHRLSASGEIPACEGCGATMFERVSEEITPL